MKIGADYYFYQNDHLGTPQKLTAVNGTVVWAAKYSSFGKATIEVETVENNLRFPGQIYDEETGLHYNWFRYYDSKIGLYLRIDPIGFWSGNLNLYAYVSNAPTNGFDAIGLWQYKAFCRYISGGEGLGGGVLKCHVEGPYMKNNKKRIWMTKTILVGFTAVSPGGVTYFSMDIDDQDWSSEYPDGSKLLGFSHLYSAGGAVPSFGGSYADVKLGSAYYKGFGKQTGIDASADVFWGYTFMNDDIAQNTWLGNCCHGQN